MCHVSSCLSVMSLISCLRKDGARNSELEGIVYKKKIVIERERKKGFFIQKHTTNFIKNYGKGDAFYTINNTLS